MQDDKAVTHTTDGFPYFWLGREAESIPTPWQTVWLGSSTELTMIGASDGRLYRANDHGLWEYADGK